MAFTKINAAGIGSTETVTLDGLTVINDGSFGGNVSVGGTLTYEDVTNIDSVGLITARAGVLVGSGITLSKDGDVFFTGIATGNGSGLTALNASNISSGTVPTARLGSGTASSSTFLRGDSTFAAVTSTTISNNADNRLITGTGTANTINAEANITFDGTSLNLLDNKNIYLGTGNDLRIWHDGNNNYSQISGSSHGLYIDGSTTYMRTSDGSSGVENAIVMNGNSSVDLYHSGTKKFETNSTGSTLFCTGNGNNEGPKIEGSSSMPAILNFQADAGAADGDKCRFYGHQSGGQLLLQDFSAGSFQNMANFKFGGAVELYHNGTKKFETQSTGTLTSGIAENRQNSTDTDFTNLSSPASASGIISQNVQGAFNTFNALTLVSHSANAVGMSGSLVVKNHSGSGYSPSIFITQRNGGNSQRILQEMTSAGACKLNYDGSAKLETTSSGVTVNGNLELVDDDKLYLGDSGDLQIYHNGTHGYVENTTGTLLLQNTGQTTVKGTVVQFENAAGTEVLLRASQDGSVKLYYDNSSKLETTSNGIQVNGRAYAKAQSLTSSLVGQFDPSVFDVNGSAQSTETVAIKSQKNDCLDLTRYYTSGAIQTFRFNNDFTGSITTGTTSVAYNTSSDYRLKENAVAILDGITRLKQLKPYKFNFKAEPSVVHDGFFAHEVTPIVPTAVSGEKDATETRYYEKGDILPSGKVIGDVKDENAIIPQSLDHSKLVPLLVAAVQELIGKVEALEG